MLSRPAVLLLFFLLIVAIGLSSSGCAKKVSIQGMAFTTGKNGNTVPLAQKKVTIYRGNLPDSIREAFKWQNDSLAVHFSRARARLSDTGSDLLVVSAYSDLSLPDSIRLEEWCQRREESYQKKIAECITLQAIIEKECEKAEQSTKKITNSYRKDLALQKGCRDFSWRNIILSQQKRVEEEQARKDASLYIRQFKYYRSCLMDDCSKADQSVGDNALLAHYIEKAREDNSRTKRARQAALDALMKVRELASDSSEYLRMAQEQQQQSNDFGISADMKKEGLDIQKDFSKTCNERLWEIKEKKENLEKSSKKFRAIEGDCIKGMELKSFTGRGFDPARKSSLLGELAAQCGLVKTTDIPSWYEACHSSIVRLFDENRVTDITTGPDGSFNISTIAPGTYYLIIDCPEGDRGEMTMVRQINTAYAAEPVLISDDFAYKTLQWGIFRNGLSLFWENGE